MTQPLTSQTEKPGFVPNEAGNWAGASGTNAYWRETLAKYMASEWAHGNRDKVLEIISPTWLSAKYGEPDPSDVASGDKLWSDRTILAFSKWAADYQPGWSPYIDQVLPYIPPGPNDFIETPEQTANRITQDELQNSEAEGARQFDITQRQSAFNAWLQGELDKFATQSDIYNNNEGNRSENLRTAGDLSSALQAAWDARTKSALDQRADPGDYLKAEYETRAIAPPVGSTSPAYKDVDSLMEVIRRLIEYKPADAPVGPDQGTKPVNPADTPYPAFGSYKNESQTTVPGSPLDPSTTTPMKPAQYENVPDYVNNRPPPQGNYGLGTPPAGQPILMPDGTVKSPNNPLPGFARGIQGTRAREFITGDPAVANVPNPEHIKVNKPGPKTTVTITPVRKMQERQLRGKKMFADGSGSGATVTTYPDEAYQGSPRQKYLTGGSARDYGKLATGFAGAAFGMKVPESGRLNYGKFLNLAQDPVALAMTGADYKSANRDLASVVARAKARAPLGQSLNTSLVRY